ncbi:MAG: hypothetical protein ACP5O1_03720 [Phycisphaerae bacterium]
MIRLNQRRIIRCAAAVGVALSAVCGSFGVRAAQREPKLQLWLYCSTNLLVHENVIKTEQLWRTAAHDGYSHILLNDSKFSHLPLLGSSLRRYTQNVRRVRVLAKHLHLTLVPAVCPIGYSNDLLALKPSLAAGLPVKSVPFVVRHQVASVLPEPKYDLPPRPPWMDSDIQFSHGEARTINPPGNARLVFSLAVHPFWAYHLRVWIRTKSFTGRPHIEVLAGRHNKNLQHEDLAVARTQTWRRYDVVFDSLKHHHVRIYLGTWGAARGELAWKDWSLQVAGLVNPLSRPGAPTRVAGFRPGVDYIVPHDPLLGRDPYPGEYSAWHHPVAIRFIKPVPDGTVVKVSWYYPPIIYGGEVAGDIQSHAFLHLLADQAAYVRSMFHSHHYMLSIDELRVMGWDHAVAGDGAAGRILARTTEYCRRLFSGDRLYTWSDMFDPLHNARKHYFLVHGSLRGSWRGLGRRMVIINWNSGHKRRSLEFFSRRGNKQIIAAYYDAPLSHTRNWLRAARGITGVIGFMYTTWRGDYRQMSAFARLVSRYGKANR